MANSSGGFDVNGNHFYAGATASTLTVFVSDEGGSTAVRTVAVTVSGAAVTLESLVPPPATEGTAISGVMAHFTCANPSAPVEQFSATITWADGTTSLGTVSASSGGGFDVSASHTYSDVTVGVMSVFIAGNVGASTSGSIGSVTVADAPLTMGSVLQSAGHGRCDHQRRDGALQRRQ